MRTRPTVAGLFSTAACMGVGAFVAVFALNGNVPSQNIWAYVVMGGLIVCLGIGLFLNDIGVLPERHERDKPRKGNGTQQ